MDWSPPGSSVRGILQARRLEGVAVSYSSILPDHRIEPVSLVSPALPVDSLPLGSAPESLVCVSILMREEGTSVTMLCKNLDPPFTALLVMTLPLAQSSAHLSSSVSLHTRSASAFSFSGASLSSLPLLILFSPRTFQATSPPPHFIISTERIQGSQGLLVLLPGTHPLLVAWGFFPVLT